MMAKTQYGRKTEAIKDYLRKHAYQKASLTDISRYTGLSRDEIKNIVSHDSDLTLEYNGDYVKNRS